MKSFVVLSAIITLASALTVNTPVSVVVCEPLQITWSPEGAVSPFYLSIVPAGQPTANAIKRFPRQDGTSYIWSAVDVPAGTSFTIDLKDGKGQEAFSAPVTAQGGGDTSCINGNVEEDGATRSPNSAAPGSVSPGVAAAESSGASEASSSPAAAAASSPTPAEASPSSAPASPRPQAASSSGGSASPSQSPSVKANSTPRDASRALFGIMGIVGLMSVAVFLVN